MANTTIYLIDRTDGTSPFAIQPRTFDGLGGVQTNTDLTLYGNATPNWGERFNENFYKLLENFAIDQNATFNPLTTTPPSPLNQSSITGGGINNPIIGQLWYNKTDGKLYIYAPVNPLADPIVGYWRNTAASSTTKPTTPLLGDLWFDGSVNLLNFWDGSVWIALAASSGSSFVSTAGDTMTGALEISDNSDVIQLSLHNNNGAMISMASDATVFGASVPPSILMYNPDNNPTINGNNGSDKAYVRWTNRDTHFFTIEADNVETTGNGAGTEVILFSSQLTDELVYNKGEVLLLGSTLGTITNAKHVATKEYVDTVAGGGGFVLKTGDTMTGDLIFDTSTTNKEILFDPGSNFAGGGPVKISYEGNAVLFQSNYGSGGAKNLLSLEPTTSTVSFDHNVNFIGPVVANGGISITGANINMLGGGDIILDHDPVAPLEAATMQYVDINGGVTVGFVLPFSTNTTPAGFLRCNGSAVSRTVYSNLFAALSTTYGVGDGSTTFNLPDLRGEFIRGTDDGRGVDLGRTVGTSQLDEFKSHNHDVASYAGFLPSSLRINSATLISLGGALTGNRGGTETRPRNVAMLYCIKY